VVFESKSFNILASIDVENGHIRREEQVFTLVYCRAYVATIYDGYWIVNWIYWITNQLHTITVYAPYNSQFTINVPSLLTVFSLVACLPTL
jgi:hypothetical protein